MITLQVFVDGSSSFETLVVVKGSVTENVLGFFCVKSEEQKKNFAYAYAAMPEIHWIFQQFICWINSKIF